MKALLILIVSIMSILAWAAYQDIQVANFCNSVQVGNSYDETMSSILESNSLEIRGTPLADRDKVAYGEPLSGTEIIGFSSLLNDPCGVKFENGLVVDKWLQY